MTAEPTHKTLALIMVVAMVGSMMVAGVGSVAADHDDASSLSDGDTIEFGQHVSYSASTINTAEIQDSSGTTVVPSGELNIQQGHDGSDYVTFDADHEGLRPDGDYTLQIENTGDSTYDASVSFTVTGPAEISDGDRIWVGQEVVHHNSEIDGDSVAELYDTSGETAKFLTEISVNKVSGNDYVRIDTVDRNLSAGSYKVQDVDGNKVAGFEVSEQSLSISADSSTIETDGNTDFTVDSNRVSFDVYVSADNMDIDKLNDALGLSGNSYYQLQDDGTYSSVTNAADATHVKVNSQGLSFDAGKNADIAAGDYTLDFDVVDTAATTSANLSIVEAGSGNAEFDGSVYTVPEGDTTDFNVSIEETDTAYLHFGSEDVGFSPVYKLDASNLEDGEMATLTFNSLEAGDGDGTLALKSDDVGITAHDAEENLQSAGTHPLDQHDYSMELTLDDAGDESTDLATMSVGPHDEPIHSGTYVTGDSLTTADFDEDEVSLHSGSMVAKKDSVVAVFNNVGFTDYADMNSAGWHVVVEESEPGVNQDAQVIAQSNYYINWDQDKRTATVVVDTDAAGLSDGDEYDISLMLDAAQNNYFDDSNYDETVDVDDDADGAAEHTITPVYEANTSFEVDERVVEFDHETNDNGTFEFTKATDGTITVEGSGTAAPGTEYTVVLRSDNADDPVIKDSTIELDENGDFSTTFNVSERSEGWEFTLDIRGPDSANDEPVDSVIASEEVKGYTVDVNVEDADGNAIDNASVTVNGESDWGEFEYATNVVVEATADGYTSASKEITVDENETVTLTLEEQTETFPVDVTVEDADGNAISDATVTVNGESDWGEFEEGTTVTVEANADGYKSASKDVTVTGETSVTLTLEEESSDSGKESGGSDDSGTSDDSDTSGDSDDSGTSDDSNEQEGPGFGVAVAIVALLGAAMLALRRQN